MDDEFLESLLERTRGCLVRLDGRILEINAITVALGEAAREGNAGF